MQWKVIDSVLGRSPVKKSEVELYEPCDKVCNKFNEHFSRLGNNKLIKSIDENYKKYLPKSPNFSMYLTPTTPNEVEIYILWI